jgi:hypothetical protein
LWFVRCIRCRSCSSGPFVHASSKMQQQYATTGMRKRTSVQHAHAQLTGAWFGTSVSVCKLIATAHCYGSVFQLFLQIIFVQSIWIETRELRMHQVPAAMFSFAAHSGKSTLVIFSLKSMLSLHISSC